MNAPSELGGFLRSRRARVTPQAAGLPDRGRRRVAGLRREEVAELAGVSLVYYTRLEQGRARNPSDAVLAALGRVLRLDPAEQAHLRDLARDDRSGRSPTADTRPPSGAVRENLRRLVAAVGAVPAYVLNPAMDVLAANDLARALVAAPDWDRPPFSLARQVFLDPGARRLYPHWDEVARQTVGFLRYAAGRRPEEPALLRLVGELSPLSEEFRALWAERDVAEKTYGTKSFRHPLVGGFDLAYETLGLPGDEGLSLVVFTAPDARADAALRLLGSWSTPGPPHGRQVPGAFLPAADTGRGAARR
ncbi:helix-turn-helix domain-containing protein [Streptomyces sp. CC77]|uniref:helix-turn-helix domain-containing protein n=1 Tax=Streptomyces sp. CC77 TaxID=1906739 RepID=UPI0008DD6C76|nr:helix-turn-helix transcriptional regulator [Streptomyces sp. CC77]OII68244.1 transcriptional regulator [Streptomyces sp. CC77]